MSNPTAPPATVPRWAELNDNGGTSGYGTPAANVVAPPSGNQDTGYVDGTYPPAGWWNWFAMWTCNWILWLNSLTAQALTWTATQTFQAAMILSGGLFSTGASGVNGGAGVIANGATGSNGNGGTFNGSGTATGVAAVGGSSNGNGVIATGIGSGNGVTGMSTGNGIGVSGVSDGSGAGVEGTSATGAGGIFQSTSGPGAELLGNATAAPLRFAAQSAPSTPIAGDVYFDGVTGKFCFCQVTGTWITLTLP